MNQTKWRMGRRLLGLAIAAILVWVVVKTVPWQDRLLVEVTEGSKAVELKGEIQTRWQAGEVRFQVGTLPESQTAIELFAEDQVLTATATGLQADGHPIEVHGVEWRPGLPKVFRELQWKSLLPALLLLIGCTLVIITRWHLLLNAAGCPTRWTKVLRVTYVGLFFNLILPGVNGGDLARAYWMIKGHPERKASALMSVFMDRFLGLFAMALLATLTIYTTDGRFDKLKLPVTLFTSAMLIGGLVMVHPWLRSHLSVNKLLDRLPASEKLHALDAALRHYGTMPKVLLGSILLSVANHLGAAASLYVLGHAFGDTHSFLDWIVIATVMNTLSALPLSPGGLGVGEVLAGSLLRLAGGSFTIGVAASITYRLGMFSLGLLGGLLLLLPGGAAMREEWHQAEALAESEDDATLDPPVPS